MTSFSNSDRCQYDQRGDRIVLRRRYDPIRSAGLQALGSFATVAATLGISLLMMFALKWIGVLRISKAGELEGLDLHEHGASAYPEYALAGVGNSSGGNSASFGKIESIPIAED